MNAAQDWETTCAIYESLPTSTILDKKGYLLRGTIELKVPIHHICFCRKLINENNNSYRFWKELQEELIFRVVFWCHPTTSSSNKNEDECVENEYDYRRLEISLQSSYPHSFPDKDEWMEWITTQTRTILKEEPLSYSVCMFVEQQVFEFYTCLYNGPDRTLIQFDSAGPTFYEQSTIVVAGFEANKGRIPLFPMQRYTPNGSKEIIHSKAVLTASEVEHIFPLLAGWKEWLPVECPICFDSISPQEAVNITCDHSFCRLCISTYLRLKAEGLHSEYKNNPFTCPLPKCRQDLKIIGCVKQFLPKPLMDKVRQWYKDVKNPPCWSLPQCIKKNCLGVMRKEQVDSSMIFCDLCGGRWCELCLRRAPRDKLHQECPHEVAVHFCERYLAAGKVAQQRCEQKWPWIKVYAKSRVHDLSVVQWIQENGQICPGCKTGVERVEGCFHISCQCGTHFCYECGAQIHPPFYGTHHCWEETGFQ